jgi:hypothetical protein
MFWPSSLAGPVNGAEIPNRISLSVIPRTMRVQDAPFPIIRVIEKLATSDKVTLTAERQPDRKMRVTSNSWDGEKVLFRNEVLEVPWVEGRQNVSRKVSARRLNFSVLELQVVARVAIELRIDSGDSSELLAINRQDETDGEI